MMIASINILKIIASIMVITIHVSAINFPKLGAEQWSDSNIYNSFSRVCVPLFFMISGYFLVSRSGDIVSFYRNRLPKIAIPLVFWSAFFYIFNHLYFGAELYSPLQMLIKPASTHLWFLYAMLGMYLICPFISKIYINSKNIERLIFIAFWFVSSSLLPMINSYFGMIVNAGLLQLTSIYGYIGFFFVGAWVKDNQHIISFRLKLSLLSIYVLGSLCTMILTESSSLKSGQPNMLFYSYLSPVVVISSVAIFYLFAVTNIHSKVVAWVGDLFSKFSLGVYCVHTAFIGIVAKEFHIGGDVSPSILWIPITVILTFSLSCATSLLCSKVPFLRRVF